MLPRPLITRTTDRARHRARDARRPRTARHRLVFGVGFSLLEMMFALLLLGLILLMSMGLMAQEARVVERLQAHREALSTLDRVHEAMRTGLFPVVTSGPLDLTPLEIPAPRRARSLIVEATVEPLHPAQLTRVELVARYIVRGQRFTRRLETRQWQP